MKEKCKYCNQKYENMTLHIKLKHECQICGEIISNPTAFSNHLRHRHKIRAKEYADKYVYLNKIPTCKCGCGEITKFRAAKGYDKYLYLHDHKDKELQKEKNRKLRERTREEKYKSDKQRKETKLKRYGDKNYCNVKKIKQTKLERYGDENYRNSKLAAETMKNKSTDEKKKINELKRKTKLNRYNSETYNNRDKALVTNLYKYDVPWSSMNDTIKEKQKLTLSTKTDEQRLEKDKKHKQTKLEKYGTLNMNIFRKWTKHSKAEKILWSSKKDKFSQSIIIQYREFDSYHKKSNTLIELDGTYYHSATLNNLHFEQLNSIFNDIEKEKIAKANGFNLIRIRSEEIIDKDWTIEELQEIQYFHDFSYDENTVIMSKSYLKDFIDRNQDKIEVYKQLLLSFLQRLLNKSIPTEFIDNLFLNPVDLTFKQIQIELLKENIFLNF